MNFIGAVVLIDVGVSPDIKVFVGQRARRMAFGGVRAGGYGLRFERFNVPHGGHFCRNHAAGTFQRHGFNVAVIEHHPNVGAREIGIGKVGRGCRFIAGDHGGLGGQPFGEFTQIGNVGRPRVEDVT